MNTFCKLLLLIFFLSISCKKAEHHEDSIYNGLSTAAFNQRVEYDSITDIEGNSYKIVTIGSQKWMAENLRTTRYSDGSNIPLVTEERQWESLTTGAYCNVNNEDEPIVIATYGRLYNHYAVETGKLSPEGWHIPSNAEWRTLNDFLGSHFIAGGFLKETGFAHWNEPNTAATNSTGFTALPAGFRYTNGEFEVPGDYGYWWSSTLLADFGADGRNMYSFYPYLYYAHYLKQAGFSVRCIKD